MIIHALNSNAISLNMLWTLRNRESSAHLRQPHYPAGLTHIVRRCVEDVSKRGKGPTIAVTLIAFQQTSRDITTILPHHAQKRAQRSQTTPNTTATEKDEASRVVRDRIRASLRFTLAVPAPQPAAPVDYADPPAKHPNRHLYAATCIDAASTQIPELWRSGQQTVSRRNLHVSISYDLQYR